MTAVVLVHGVPDTHEVWDEVRARLADRDARTLSLPGFGCPTPEGFDCSRWGYAEWLARELESVGEPVDLVAHDIGSLIAHPAIQERPELFRSWVLTGACDGEYGWHRTARMWQTSRLGEQTRELWLGADRDARIALLTETGMPRGHAADVSERLDATMYDAILDIYRSSCFVGDWELSAGPTSPPGHLIWGADDPFQGPEWGRRLAARTGARLTVLEDCGHWWQVERPDEAVGVLREFWARVDDAVSVAS